MSESTSGSTSVRAVVRALDVLRCFTADRTLLSVAEIGRQVALSRPTLYRLLATLQHAGFVHGEGEPLRFRLGAAIGPLVQAWSSNLNLQQVSAPILAELRKEAEETVALLVPRGDQRLCVAELPGPHALTVVRGVGSTAPLARGASGKVILAYMRDKKITSRDLAKIRRAGLAVSRGELMPGVIAIAAPFFDRSGSIAGAVAVFAAEVRFDARRERDVARMVKDAAARISTLMGQPRGQPASGI
jgi:DNA-binding IclR family transcriptional regulator